MDIRSRRIALQSPFEIVIFQKELLLCNCNLLVFAFGFIPKDASRAGDKYETSSTNVGYSKFMKLKIRSVGPGDFGSYRCVAKNSLGETDGLIKLDGKYMAFWCFMASHCPSGSSIADAGDFFCVASSVEVKENWSPT